jgi:hypothetical protein
MEKEKMKGGYKKGQAVMEYLITYGLALFVILIVLAILVAVVLPSLRAPETCQFTQPGFTCNVKPHVLVADNDDNVRIVFQLDNTQGKAVNVLGVSCITTSPGNVRKSDIDPLPGYPDGKVMAAGESITIGGLGADIEEEMDCMEEDGSTQTVLAPNSDYQGVIAVKYKFQNDVPGAPDRLAVATVTGTVQAE